MKSKQSINVLSPKMINSVTVGFFMPPEILRVGFIMDFPKSVGFSMVVFLWFGFLCKSHSRLIYTIKAGKIHSYFVII